MATFDILNRSPDGSTYFAEDGMNGWLYCPIVEMVSRGFDGSVVLMDYMSMQMSAVPGFPQLYFRVYGHFNFGAGVTSGGTGAYVLAGSVINRVEVIDASGLVYSYIDGISFAINSDKTTTAIEPINVFANSFRPGENPEMAVIMSGNDYVTGSAGTEWLYGYGGNDTLLGEGGSDALAAGFGNDSLVGGDGADDLYGQAGNDIIVGYTAGDYIDGGGDFDTWALTGTFASGIGLQPQRNYTSVSFYGIEAIRVTWGEIVLNSNQIGGATPVQTVYAGSVNRDALRVMASPGGGPINLSGVTFVDWNNWSGEFDRITLEGTAGADTIDGSQMNDAVWGNGGSDLIRGLGGYDAISGADGNDTLRGGGGGDTLNGWDGNDLLVGDDGFAEGGDDAVNGGGGNDTILTGRGFNLVNGGAGIDTIEYRFAISNVVGGVAYPVAVQINLATVVDPSGATGRASTYIDIGTPEITTPVARDFLIGIENVQGSNYTDHITGNSVANRLNGWNGNDTILGGGGNDTLVGGNGNDYLNGGGGVDRIYGGLGNDILAGGLDADHFHFDTVLNAATNRDTIRDFSVVDDQIVLENAIFAALTATGTLAAGLFKNVNLAAIDTNDRIIFSPATGSLFYDADGSGAGTAIRFAVLTGSPAITAADLLVI